ncbi:hypothetical protein BBJ28_00001715 [Nothophytophthora sp. Chile5]|nr:hypothetical protein BBJ28_00001715 [Nothophytophthora sp. Chile5]
MAPSTTSGGLVARVRPSCAALVAHEDSSVRVNAEKVHAFVEELDWTQFGELTVPMRFPLNFRTQQDEINFLSASCGFRLSDSFASLQYKRASICIDQLMFGLLGMYISVPKLNARFMQGLSLDLVANYFSIPLERDEELSPGIYIAKPILNECGQKLVEREMEDFGAFVLANLSSSGSGDEEEKQGGSSAVHLVQQLVTTFPAFDDHRECRGEKVYFLKRAQLAVESIYRRFKYDAELEARINRGEELPAGQQECELRAAGIVACDQIVAESKGRLSTLDVSFYLWRVGKEERFRGLERHATRDTFFY